MATCQELKDEYRTANIHRRNEIERQWLDQNCEVEIPGGLDLSGPVGPPPPPPPG